MKDDERELRALLDQNYLFDDAVNRINMNASRAAYLHKLLMRHGQLSQQKFPLAAQPPAPAAEDPAVPYMIEPDGFPIVDLPMDNDDSPLDDDDPEGED